MCRPGPPDPLQGADFILARLRDRTRSSATAARPSPNRRRQYFFLGKYITHTSRHQTRADRAARASQSVTWDHACSLLE